MVGVNVDWETGHCENQCSRTPGPPIDSDPLWTAAWTGPFDARLVVLPTYPVD